MAYFASHKDSDRARRFREAYRNAIMGQDFMFEDQPYARPGPSGLLTEEGSGTMTGYEPIERISPYDLAYITPEHQARLDEKANEKRLGTRIGGRSKVLRDQSDWDRYVRRWVEPEGTFAQSPHALDLLEDQGTKDRWASENPPRFMAANQMGTAEGFTHGMNTPGADVTGRYAQSGGEGLLSESDYKLYDWLDNPTPIKQEQPSLLADNSDTDKSGWEKDKKFNDALRQMVMQWGMNQVTEDEF